MFNKRWKRVLLWILSAIVVLSVGGLFAANYAVDKLMNSMAGGFELESDKTDNGSQEEGTVPTVTVVVPTATSSPAPAPTEGGENIQAEVSQEKAETTTGEQTASATSEPTSTPSTSSNKGYTAQISTDKAKEIQGSVTVKEKADVASIVLGQLSVADIKRLQELANGGLSIEEKREARSIVLGKVSEEQYNELSQIAKKYGVSRGLTHEQVIAEEKGSE
ncbi:hypothetical protein PaeBR_07685 [Paenibacillus sp. BR2-3]|uniref:hypothetical protein n=1 Tax=Paenibacillus sp. BR2-3 TaxID=3048494 RepID=UPI003977E379